jgi:Spy/CpxP family protein refolding chaperone
MSMPYPQDRARARKDAGEQPFKDDREAMNEADAALHREASTRDGFDTAESEEERNARQEAEASERLADIGDDVASGQDPS